MDRRPQRAGVDQPLGGAVTHELGVISAVGARLTPAQRAALEGHEAVARIYDDRPVGVDNACAVTGGFLELDGKKLKWQLINPAAGGLTIPRGA